MRHMSFAMTATPFLNGSKTVTRRRGWSSLQPGDRVMAVRKGQGLRKGEKVEHLGEIVIVAVDVEPVNAIDAADVRREGFSGHTPVEFVAMFCRHMKCEPGTLVTRIEFRRVAARGAKGPPPDLGRAARADGP